MTRRIRRLGLSLRALVLGAVLAACGGGGGGGSAQADATSAKVWAGAVCGQVGGWLQQVQSLGTNFASAVQNVGADLPAAKAQLSGFFGDLVRLTDQMIQAVGNAGVPDTAKGKQIADDLKAGLSEVNQAFSASQARIQNLSTSDPSAFEQQVQQAFNDLTAAGDKIGQKFEGLDKKYNVPALQEAFEQAPECQAVNS